jgi:hypothetical protein
VKPLEPEEIVRLFKTMSRTLGETGRALAKLAERLIQSNPSEGELLGAVQQVRNARAETNVALEILCDHYAEATGSDWRQVRHQMGVGLGAGRNDGDDPGVPPWVATFNEPPLPGN